MFARMAGKPALDSDVQSYPKPLVITPLQTSDDSSSMSSTFDGKEPQWHDMNSGQSNSPTSEETRTVLGVRSASSSGAAQPFDEFYKNHPEHKLHSAGRFEEPISPCNDSDGSSSPSLNALLNKERKRGDHVRTKSGPHSGESDGPVRRSQATAAAAKSKVQAMKVSTGDTPTSETQVPTSPVRKRATSLHKGALNQILGEQKVAEAFHFVSGPRKSLPSTPTSPTDTSNCA